MNVGDVVIVESGEGFPADLILLASDKLDGVCFVETCSLDGEKALKVKSAIK